MKKQIAGLLALALLLSGCGPQTVTQAPTLREPASVSLGTVKATRGEMYEIASYDAYVTPCSQVLCFGVSGKMGETLVKVGDRVEAGTVLASMDTTSTQTKLESVEEKLADIKKKGEFSDRIAKADIKIAEAELAILEEEGATAEECAVQKARIAKLKAALEQAQELRSLERKPLQKQVEELKAQLDAQEIKAPFAGTVVYVTGTKFGKSIGEDTPVIVLADDNDLRILCEQELDANLLSHAYRIYARVGDQEYDLTWQPPEETGDKTTLVITESEEDTPVAQKVVNGTTFALTEEMSQLEAGTYVSVLMVLAYRENVLKLPKNALYKDAVGYYVYRIEDGQRFRQDVKVGISTSLDTEIVSGLQEGDVVYVE